MRKLLILILSFSFVMFSCKRETKPEEVLKKFANHFAAAQYLEAADFATPQTVEMLEMMDALSSVGMHSNVKTEPHVYIIEDFDCEVDGDIAYCSFIDAAYDEKVEVTLFKADGIWLVDIPLDDIIDDDDWYEEEDDWHFDGSEARTNR